MRNWILFGILFTSALSWSQNANSWVKKSDFAGFKREQAVGFSIDTKGYIGTGVDTSETVLKDFWEYDPSLDSWTQRADLPGSGRRNAFGFAMNGKGYIGAGIDNDEATIGVKLADFYEYNPTTNTWTQKADFPGGGGLGLYYATAFSADGKGYVCGGKVGQSDYVDEFWEYKPTTNQWTQRASFPGGIRYNMSSLVIDNVAYLGLGTDQNTYQYDWWQYNPGNNIWTAQNHFIGGQRGGASTFVINGKGYVCLGTNGGLKDDLYIFDPVTQSWYPRANYGGSERKQAVAFVIGNSAYVGTGAGAGGKKGSMYEYIPMDVLSIPFNDLGINCFPVPAAQQVQIQSPKFIISTVRLMNQQGQIVFEEKCHTNEYSIARNQLAAGNYTLSLEFENGAILSQTTIQFID